MRFLFVCFLKFLLHLSSANTSDLSNMKGKAEGSMDQLSTTPFESYLPS